MCREEGMAIAPWGAIGQGRFQRKADQGKSKDGRSAQKLSEDEIKVSAALEKVADDLKVESITAVATAYVMSKVSGANGYHRSFSWSWHSRVTERSSSRDRRPGVVSEGLSARDT